MTTILIKTRMFQPQRSWSVGCSTTIQSLFSEGR